MTNEPKTVAAMIDGLARQIAAECEGIVLWNGWPNVSEDGKYTCARCTQPFNFHPGHPDYCHG